MATPAVVFPIGKDFYAVPTSAVREVVPEPHTTRLPTGPVALLGAFNLRGEVVPMFDTAALLGIGNAACTPVAVVVNTSAGPAGLVVGGLPRFAVLDGEVGPSELHGTLGVYAVDGDLAVMLDIEAMLIPQSGAHEVAAAEVLSSA